MSEKHPEKWGVFKRFVEKKGCLRGDICFFKRGAVEFFVKVRMHFLDAHNILVLTALMIHALLLCILKKYAWNTRAGKAYSFTIFFIAAWTLSMFFYRSSFFSSILFWTRALYISAACIPVAFTFFGWSFLQSTRSVKYILTFLYAEVASIILLLLHPTFIISDVIVRHIGEHTIVFGELYPLYVLHVVSFFLAGFYFLGRTYFQIVSIKEKKQVRAIVVGFLIASSLAMITNLFLPWFGYFELNWLGQIFSTIVAAFTTYAILRYQLLNIDLIALELFIFVLNFFFILSLISFYSTEDTSELMFTLFLMSFFAISYVSIKKARELSTINSRLQHTNKQKSDFLSIAAHQCRTPVTIISGYLELLRDEAFGKPTEQMKDVFKNMNESNAQLQVVVDNFLNVQRIEEDEVHYEFKKQDIGLLISSIVDTLLPKVKEKGLQLYWNRESLVCRYDTLAMTHVLTNLIENAVKYTNNGSIEIKACYTKEHKVHICVKDDGIGFDQNDAAQFFEPFYRGENVKREVSMRGTGLGLYIVKKFIEAHGGQVWAKSTGLGRGSVFGITLESN